MNRVARNVPSLIKRQLKKIPLLVCVKRFLFRAPHHNHIGLYFIKLFTWIPFLNSRVVRMLIFDSAPNNTFLISSASKEFFVVSSQDKSIGRNVFIGGEYDFDKVGKALDILGANRPSLLLVDVGANVGTICIPAVKRGFFEKAIAIEPEPFNFGILVSNVHLNNLADKITTYNLALGSHDSKELSFELSDTNYGDHRIKVSDDVGVFDEDRRKIVKVSSDTFDKVVGEIDPTGALIWMDTQGYEGYILAGATKALMRHTPLVIEFWPYGMVRSGSYLLLKESILNAGYKSFYNLDAGAFPIPMSPESLDNLYKQIGDKGSFTDLLIC
jgi:FkbM family methyltransferase